MLTKTAHLSSYALTLNVRFDSMRKSFGDALVKLGEQNENVVVLTTDLMRSTQVDKFAHAFPNRFVQVGIAEQNMAAIAAGLALSGKIPFMVAYAQFSPGRNWDQIKTAIAYSKANVKIVGTHAGLSVGPDGATHQALEDIALTRVLPNITVVSPADAIETTKATFEIAKHKGPVYMRIPRSESEVFTSLETPFEIGKAELLMEGKDISIIATGTMVYESLQAAKELKMRHGITADVINVSTIKPLDTRTIVKSARKTRKLVTVEDHQVAGGLGSAVLELMATKLPVYTKCIGVEDSFGESGTYEQLKEKFGLTSEAIMAEIKSIIIHEHS